MQLRALGDDHQPAAGATYIEFSLLHLCAVAILWNISFIHHSANLLRLNPFGKMYLIINHSLHQLPSGDNIDVKCSLDCLT